MIWFYLFLRVNANEDVSFSLVLIWEAYLKVLLLSALGISIVGLIIVKILTNGQFCQFIKFKEDYLYVCSKASVASGYKNKIPYEYIIDAYCDNNDVIIIMAGNNMIRCQKMKDAFLAVEQIKFMSANKRNINYNSNFNNNQQ